MRFHDPIVLVLLVLPAAIAWREWRRTPRPATVRFPHVDVLRRLGTGRRSRFSGLPAALAIAALVLGILALARPQAPDAETRIRTEGIDVELVVDVSGSMLAHDFELDGRRASRLDAVKHVVGGFLDGRAGDRVGLVLFGARPYVQCPLSLDHGWLAKNLERAEVGMIEDGTAVGSALAAAVDRLAASGEGSKVAILLTDGRSNAGKITPLTAADAAAALGVRVYTIGTGAIGPAPYPATDPFGRRVFHSVSIDLDEETLEEIARRTGGRYWRATDTETLAGIYAEIDTLEPSPHEGLIAVAWIELYPWILVPALLALLASALLEETWLRVLP